MKLSVIIPCYNGAETLGEQLDALGRQPWDQPWEIIVADNGSSDRSREVVGEYQSKMTNLTLVDASQRRGQPFALNAGAAKATGESLAFCDADDVAGEGWVAAIGRSLEDSQFVASRFEFNRLNAAATVMARRNKQSVGLQPYLNPPFLPHAGGCGLGIRRDVFLRAGGFSEDFPALHDTDLCWKLQLQGIQLHFAADAVMHIRFRKTMADAYRQARSYGQYNVLLYKRYRPLGMPSASWMSGVRGWLSLALAAPRLITPMARIRWARHLGRRVGRLRGCILYRTFAL